MRVGRSVSAARRRDAVECLIYISGRDIQICELPDARDLNVVRSLNKVRALDGAVGDDTGATATLGAPGDDDALGIPDT